MARVQQLTMGVYYGVQPPVSIKEAGAIVHPDQVKTELSCSSDDQLICQTVE